MRIPQLWWPTVIAAVQPTTTMTVSWATAVALAKQPHGCAIKTITLSTMIDHRFIAHAATQTTATTAVATVRVVSISHIMLVAAMAVTVAPGHYCNWINAVCQWWRPPQQPPLLAIQMVRFATIWCIIVDPLIARHRASMDHCRTVSPIYLLLLVVNFADHRRCETNQSFQFNCVWLIKPWMCFVLYKKSIVDLECTDMEILISNSSGRTLFCGSHYDEIIQTDWGSMKVTWFKKIVCFLWFDFFRAASHNQNRLMNRSLLFSYYTVQSPAHRWRRPRQSSFIIININIIDYIDTHLGWFSSPAAIISIIIIVIIAILSNDRRWFGMWNV